MYHDYLISVNLKICLNAAAAQPGTEIFNLPAVTTSGMNSKYLLKREHSKEIVGMTLMSAAFNMKFLSIMLGHAQQCLSVGESKFFLRFAVL